jgi:hypothetical protein
MFKEIFPLVYYRDFYLSRIRMLLLDRIWKPLII